MDLNPDYQRDVVWTPDRMTSLINSLMCKFYIPPLIFNVISVVCEDGASRYKRISIDGKQRLTSIRDKLFTQNGRLYRAGEEQVRVIGHTACNDPKDQGYQCGGWRYVFHGSMQKFSDVPGQILI
jgi:hypothetical protein